MVGAVYTGRRIQLAGSGSSEVPVHPRLFRFAETHAGKFQLNVAMACSSCRLP
jgi:hypothetical protein